METKGRYRPGSRKAEVFDAVVENGREAAIRAGRKRHLKDTTLRTWTSTWSSTTVTSKGQVTIPKRVRDFLGVKPGNAVQFDLSADGQVVVRKSGNRKPVKPSRFDLIRGTATAGLSTDEIMAMTRGDD